MESLRTVKILSLGSDASEGEFCILHNISSNPMGAPIDINRRNAEVFKKASIHSSLPSDSCIQLSLALDLRYQRSTE